MLNVWTLIFSPAGFFLIYVNKRIWKQTHYLRLGAKQKHSVTGRSETCPGCVWGDGLRNKARSRTKPPPGPGALSRVRIQRRGLRGPPGGTTGVAGARRSRLSCSRRLPGSCTHAGAHDSDCLAPPSCSPGPQGPLPESPTTYVHKLATTSRLSRPGRRSDPRHQWGSLRRRPVPPRPVLRVTRLLLRGILWLFSVKTTRTRSCFGLANDTLPPATAPSGRAGPSRAPRPPVHAPLPHPARQGPVGADLVTEARLSVCRRLEPRGPGTLGSCPQSLRDAPGPAVSPAPGLAFNCHPCSIRETDRRTRFWAELPLNLVFQTDNRKN